jgi:hypothetical protein
MRCLKLALWLDAQMFSFTIIESAHTPVRSCQNAWMGMQWVSDTNAPPLVESRNCKSENSKVNFGRSD